MMYLQASWGYIVMIGGLFLTLVILMLLDGPAQRRDALRRGAEHQRADEKRSAQTGGTAPLPSHPSSPMTSGQAAK
jgi:hypothetical protein